MKLNGLKPQMMVAYLGVGKESFRHWREDFDPNPHRSFFGSSDLFTYQLIKLLIREQGIPPRLLKKCGFQSLFDYFHHHTLDTIKDSLLQVDTDACTVNVLSSSSSRLCFGFSIHTVPLSQVIDEHRRSLETFGN